MGGAQSGIAGAPTAPSSAGTTCGQVTPGVERLADLATVGLHLAGGWAGSGTVASVVTAVARSLAAVAADGSVGR